MIHPPSSPGLTRRSIFFAKIILAKTMDARVKPAHDDLENPHNLAPVGAALRLRARAMRLLLGARRRRGNPFVRDACWRCGQQIADHVRGAGLVVRGAEGTGANARAASAAAGLHRRAGAAVRLLLQRHADQGLGAPGADAAPERSADPLAHGRASLPLRILSAHHEGDPACVHHDGGSNAMNAILTDTSAGPLSRRDLLKGGGALVVGFCIGGSALPAFAARGDAARPPGPNTIASGVAVHADNTPTGDLGHGEVGLAKPTRL